MKKDNSYDTVCKIANLIISTFLEKKITTDKELSHVKFDK